MPTVSVIVPTYNRAEFLPQTLDSVLTQTFEDFEIIVVDDGSTDNTKDVVSGYSDKRISYCWQPNKGPAAARNTGLRMAQGKYIAFLDSDDLWERDKIALQVALLQAEPGVVAVFTDFLIFSGNRIVLPSKFKSMRRFYEIPTRRSVKESKVFTRKTLRDLLEVGGFIFPSALVFRKECLEKVGYFNEKFRVADDTDFLLRLAKHCYYFGYLDRILARIRRHGENITADDVRHYSEAIEALLAVLKEATDLNSREVKALHKKLSDFYFGVGWHLFDQGNYAQAGKLFRSSMMYGKNLKAFPYLLATFFNAETVMKVKELKRKLRFKI